jgi:large subunit ribosomal protein L3
MTTKQQTNPKAMLGKKLGMTQVWDKNGHFIPVTVLEVGINVVTQVRNEETDGYNAVQLAFGRIKADKVTNPIKGHFEKAGVNPRRYIVEVPTQNADSYSPGQEIKANIFSGCELVDISGTTRGKGFAGTMKRYNFAGVSSSHGAHRNHRKPGSIGQCATPSRVQKGLRMSGRMGAVRHTTQNIKVYSADAEKGILIVKGAVPGPKGGIVLVKTAVKHAYDSQDK